MQMITRFTPYTQDWQVISNLVRSKSCDTTHGFSGKAQQMLLYF